MLAGTPPSSSLSPSTPRSAAAKKLHDAVEVEDTRLSICDDPGYLAQGEQIRSNYIWHRLGYSDAVVERASLTTYLEAMEATKETEDKEAPQPPEPSAFSIIGKIATESCFLQPDGNWPNPSFVKPFADIALVFALCAPDAPFNGAADDYELALRNLDRLVRDKANTSAIQTQGLRFSEISSPHVRLRHVVFEVSIVQFVMVLWVVRF